MHVSMHTKYLYKCKLTVHMKTHRVEMALLEKDRHRSFTSASLYVHILAQWINV